MKLIFKKKIIINEYLELIKNEIVIATNTCCIEKNWNKMDLIIELEANQHLNTNQYAAGAILFLICDKTIDIVNKWYDLASNYHNIDDSPSVHLNLDCFIEHRHDQSIFSLLMKKYNLLSSSYSLYNCIEYKRNKTVISKIT